MSWDVHRHRGTAAELHEVEVGASGHREIHLMDLTVPAVVLGSTQAAVVVDPTVALENGRDVVRRHSGGGVVVMDPGAVAWVDVVIPVGDPLWHDDVGEAFLWLGRAWADTLSRLGSVAGEGAAEALVHRGAPVHADLGRVVCFAGVGSGEVSVAGAKVVGMSQRRTRGWARFQCLVHERFDPADTLGLLAPHLTSGAFGARLRERLQRGVGTVVATDLLVDGLVRRLQGSDR